jgi:uncharacterized protein
MPTAPRADRHISLDALRGFAILGILMVNVQLFAMVWAAADAPLAHMDFTSFGNRAVWAITQTLFAWKFHTLFAAMFGAGIVLMLGEEEASHSRHMRRMAWLLLIGMVHAYVFWFGDILVPFALAGMLLVPARRMSVLGLLLFGVGLIAFTGLAVVGGYGLGILVGESMTLAETLQYPPDRVAQTEAIYQAGFLERMPINFGEALIWQLFQLVFTGGRIAGGILLGMAAYKSGFLTLKWPVRHYAIGAAVALSLGWLMSGWSAAHMMATEFSLSTAWQGMLAQYAGSFITAFGYASAIMWACHHRVLDPVMGVLAATGRMAFTNYLTQTLILTLIFVGTPGLGLFGQVERTGQVMVVVAIWAVQLAWSPLWLRYFHFGPMEWAWRSLTYAAVQPFRRQVASG